MAEADSLSNVSTTGTLAPEGIYPEGVTLAEVRVGPVTSFLGRGAKTTARVTTVLWGTTYVVHAATGWHLMPSTGNLTAEPGQDIVFHLPHTDQAGFRDSSGGSYSGWAYRVTVEAKSPGGTIAYEKTFQLATGQAGPIELATIADGAIGRPVSAPIATVTSILGKVGEVTAADMRAAGFASGDDLAAEVVDETTTFGAAAAGKFATGTDLSTGLEALTPANGKRPVGQGELFINVQERGVLPGNSAEANQSALSALLAGLAPNTVLHFPAGVYRHVNTAISAKSRFAIVGDHAELVATTRNQQYLRFIDCTDFVVRGITSRGATPELRQGPTRAFSLEGCARFHIDGCTAGPSEGVGIYVGSTSGAKGSTDGRVTNNFVTGTKADGIHITGGSRGIVAAGNRVRDTGDDCIAVVSYLTDATGCENVSVTGNNVNRSKSRGLACVGGVGVTFSGNTVADTRNAGIYIAVEQSYGIRPVSDVTITGNTVRGANTYTPEGDTSAFINYAGIQVVGSDLANPMSSVTVVGNTVTGSRWHGTMFGSGSEGLYGLVVSDNVVRDSGAQAMLVQQAKDVTVIGNTVIGANLDGISLVGTRGGAMVAQNTVVDVNRTSTATSRRGILVNSANLDAGAVTGNIVRDPQAKNTVGIDIGASANVEYFGNHAGNQGGNFNAAAPFVVPTTVLLAGAFPSSGTGSGVGVVGIRNAMTAPSTNPGSGVVLYAENGSLKVRGSAGTVTTLGPA